MDRVPILLYHSVSSRPHPLIADFAIAPAAFATHLDLIAERGLSTLTIDELAAAFAAGDDLRRAVAVTFDDGFRDTLTAALPALRERRQSATLYVTTGLLRGATPVLDADLAAAMLAAEELAELRAGGVQLGAHSHTHPHLDTLRGATLRDEVTRPRALLEEILGAPVTSFAYPHGYAGPRVRRTVAAAGYATACGVGEAFTSPGEDQLRLSRLMVRRDTEVATVAAWLDRQAAPGPRASESARTRGWRAYRRARATLRRRAGADPGWPAGRLPR
ncbi:MAG: hypothetical protein QOF76_3382 [Solirubrobacteraceae bacterium]|nr:hypothetical protein [Solirubrobacteraceae bacterium]